MNLKPAVGFKLPSSGVTPAPGTNRKMARTPFRSQGPFLCHSDFLCHSERSAESRLFLRFARSSGGVTDTRPPRIRPAGEEPNRVSQNISRPARFLTRRARLVAGAAAPTTRPVGEGSAVHEKYLHLHFLASSRAHPRNRLVRLRFRRAYVLRWPQESQILHVLSAEVRGWPASSWDFELQKKAA